MPPTQPGDPSSTHDVTVLEQRRARRDRRLLVLVIGVGGLLTVAWFCLLVLLGWQLIRAVV